MPDSTVIAYLGAGTIEIGRSDLTRPQEITAWKRETIDKENEQELRKIFESYFRTNDYLKKEEIHVLVLEDIFISVAEKRIFCGIILEELGCAYVSFIPRVLMYCLSYDVTNALVIDVGTNSTTCVPIFDLRPLQKYIRYSKGNKRRHLLADTPSGSPYATAFFTKEYDPKFYEDDEVPVINLAKCIVNSLPIDLRKPLRENIIVVNVEEKYKTVVKDLFKKHMDESSIRLSDDYWRGASIYAQTILHAKEENVVGVGKDEFQNNLRIAPDWFDFYFRTGMK
ncbi:hypothetical protein SEUBUCD646_0B02340 [Saccharomyces eubayanus]|uniref:Actin-like protein n=3 Tax=Saccharomyces TaxID=4930 RepID=A0A6C1E292_SACPS|nr:hypothetical protein GRS66_005910 [Saccharomyces pastorianus]CAI1823344.1 hypothetical protein SEUBUCD650_0B02350 [Saccharomyces eubayanus]CAI1858076.1 hypothetical protein SEUBUCD646_0B02340 [Saccharomyces eubayanus]